MYQCIKTLEQYTPLYPADVSKFKAMVHLSPGKSTHLFSECILFVLSPSQCDELKKDTCSKAMQING